MTTSWVRLRLLFISLGLLIIFLSIYSINFIFPGIKIYAFCSFIKTDKTTCFVSHTFSEIEKHPYKTNLIFSNFEVLSPIGLVEDPRIFLQLVHDVGMQLIDQNISPKNAYIYCGDTFKSGCKHGVIMEYLDNKPLSAVRIKDLILICDELKLQRNINDTDYLNCIHGVGHSFIAKLKGNLSLALQECKTLSEEIIHSCASGVLMEFSKGESGLGYHSHQQEKSDNLPCTEIESIFRSLCFFYKGKFLQYYPSSEPFVQSYNYCLRLSKEDIDDCILGLSDSLYIYTMGNIQKENKICENINSNAKKKCKNTFRIIKNSYL